LSPVERDSSNMGLPQGMKLGWNRGLERKNGPGGSPWGGGWGTGIAFIRRNLEHKTCVTGNTLGVFRCLR
jgi:hypothetical protein